jgi:hypothetical protein
MLDGMFARFVKFTAPSYAIGKSASRRPFSRISVWFGPSPRRLTALADGVNVLPKSAPWTKPLFCVWFDRASNTFL